MRAATAFCYHIVDVFTYAPSRGHGMGAAMAFCYHVGDVFVLKPVLDTG
jgi:hypothetical protein